MPGRAAASMNNSQVCRATHGLLQGVLHRRASLQPSPSCIRPASCRCHRRGVCPWRCAWQRRVPGETLGCCFLLIEGCCRQAWHRCRGRPCSLHMAPPCRAQAYRVLSTSASVERGSRDCCTHPLPSPPFIQVAAEVLRLLTSVWHICSCATLHPLRTTCPNQGCSKQRISYNDPPASAPADVLCPNRGRCTARCATWGDSPCDPWRPALPCLCRFISAFSAAKP